MQTILKADYRMETNHSVKQEEIRLKKIMLVKIVAFAYKVYIRYGHFCQRYGIAN